MDTFELNNQQVQKNSGKFFSGPRIIFVIIGAIIVAELIYAVKTLSSPVKPSPSPAVVKPDVVSSSPRIILTSQRTAYKVNEAIPVSIMIDTGGRSVDGSDVIVSFDNKILEATKGAVITGRIFDEYPLSLVDSAKSLISVSGVSNLQKDYKGAGQFAVINFKAKRKGKTSVAVDFQKGSTADSNLVETGTSKDILEGVGNLELNVQ